MKSLEAVFKNEQGLEARAAAALIQVASNFKSSIWIEKSERKANAKSLLGLLALAIRPGEDIVISAEGDDAAEAVGSLAEFIHKL